MIPRGSLSNVLARHASMMNFFIGGVPGPGKFSQLFIPPLENCEACAPGYRVLLCDQLVKLWVRVIGICTGKRIKLIYVFARSFSGRFDQSIRGRERSDGQSRLFAYDRSGVQSCGQSRETWLSKSKCSQYSPHPVPEVVGWGRLVEVIGHILVPGKDGQHTVGKIELEVL